MTQTQLVLTHRNYSDGRGRDDVKVVEKPARNPYSEAHHRSQERQRARLVDLLRAAERDRLADRVQRCGVVGVAKTPTGHVAIQSESGKPVAKLQLCKHPLCPSCMAHRAHKYQTRAEAEMLPLVTGTPAEKRGLVEYAAHRRLARRARRLREEIRGHEQRATDAAATATRLLAGRIPGAELGETPEQARAAVAGLIDGEQAAHAARILATGEEAKADRKRQQLESIYSAPHVALRAEVRALTGVSDATSAARAVSDGRLRMLTLTRRSHEGEPFAAAMDEVWSAWQQFRRVWPEATKHARAHCEIKYNAATDSPHVHLHVLLVSPGRLDGWRARASWSCCLGDGDFFVDVLGVDVYAPGRSLRTALDAVDEGRLAAIYKRGLVNGGLDVREKAPSEHREACKYPLEGASKTLSALCDLDDDSRPFRGVERGIELLDAIKGRQFIRSYGLLRELAHVDLSGDEVDPYVSPYDDAAAEWPVHDVTGWRGQLKQCTWDLDGAGRRELRRLQSALWRADQRRRQGAPIDTQHLIWALAKQVEELSAPRRENTP